MAFVASSNFITERLASRDFNGDELECRAKQKQEYASQKAASGSNQPNPAPDSEGDPEKIARDYCIARRSAIASEYQAEIARAAAYASYAALIAAMVAVGIAAWAAKGTWDTADHAAAAARETARSVDTLIRIEGPLLHVDKVIVDYAMPNTVVVWVRNSGKAPAILLESCVECLPDTRALPATAPAYGNPRLLDEEVLAPTTRKAVFGIIPGNGLQAYFDNDAPAVIWGYVKYETIVGRIRTHSFGFKSGITLIYDDDGVEREDRSWDRDGGKAFNNDRDI